MLYLFLQFLVLAEQVGGTWVRSAQVHFKTRLPQYQSEPRGHWHKVKSHTELPFLVPAGMSYRFIFCISHIILFAMLICCHLEDSEMSDRPYLEGEEQILSILWICFSMWVTTPPPVLGGVVVLQPQGSPHPSSTGSLASHLNQV